MSLPRGGSRTFESLERSAQLTALLEEDRVLGSDLPWEDIWSSNVEAVTRGLADSDRGRAVAVFAEQETERRAAFELRVAPRCVACAGDPTYWRGLCERCYRAALAFGVA